MIHQLLVNGDIQLGIDMIDVVHITTLLHFLALRNIIDPIQQLAVPADDLSHHPIALGKLSGSTGDPLGFFL